MNRDKEDINFLISQYAKNKLSSGQLKKLRKKLNDLSDDELFNPLNAEWERSLKGEKAQEFPAKKIVGPKKRKLITLWGSVAAVAAIFIFVFFFMEDRWSYDKELEQIADSMKDISNNTEEIQLILDTEKTVEIERGSTVKYEVDGRVSVNEKEVESAQDKEEGEGAKYNQLIVPKGKYTRIILSDGTTMYVNAGSKVVYPTSFSKKYREIYVDGEVFLDVAPDEQAPFIIKTKEFDVRVLGTVFNVNAYSDTPEEKEVVLAEGKVNIISKTGKGLILKPNDKALIYNDGSMMKLVVDADEYMAWTKGIFSLKDEQLHSILKRLSRYYGVEITCSVEIATICLTGKVDLECTVDDVLKRISTTGGFSYSKQGVEYMLTLLSE